MIFRVQQLLMLTVCSVLLQVLGAGEGEEQTQSPSPGARVRQHPVSFRGDGAPWAWTACRFSFLSVRVVHTSRR